MPSNIIEKIRRTLALAENQAGSPEGETAARIARKLMREHAIEAQDLTEQEDDPTISYDFRIEKRNQWRRDLAHALAKHCEVFSLHTIGTNTIHLYGRKSGVEVAEYLYSVVVRQVEMAVEEHVADLKAGGRWARMAAGQKRSERNSFCRSAVWTVRSRLEQMRRTEAAKSPKTTALMKQRRCEAKQFARDQGVRWSSGGGSGWDWSSAGGQAGHSININPGVRGGGGCPIGLLA